jgi:hypothetical protein
MGGSVQVNPLDLIKYGAGMLTDYIHNMSGLSDPIAGIVEHTMTGFLTPPGGSVGPLAEAVSVQRVVKRNMVEFQAFLQDVGTSVSAMQSAATAMAVAYMTTDNDSAVSLSTVDFAFGDPSGTAPKGFPTKGVSTMDQQAQDSGQYTEAGQIASANPSGDDLNTMLAGATGHKAVAGGTQYTFADGSVLVIATTPGADQYLGGSTTSMSVYKDGKSKTPTSVVANGVTYDYSGQATNTETRQSVSPSGQTVNTTTSVTKLNNGDLEITTTTPGENGKPVTHTTTVKPVDPSATKDPSRDGEVQKVEDKVNAKGTPKYSQTLGM